MEKIQFPFSKPETNTPLTRQNLKFSESFGDSSQVPGIFIHTFLQDISEKITTKKNSSLC